MTSRNYDDVDDELQDLYRKKMGSSGKDAVKIEKQIKRLIKEMQGL